MAYRTRQKIFVASLLIACLSLPAHSYAEKPRKKAAGKGQKETKAAVVEEQKGGDQALGEGNQDLGEIEQSFNEEQKASGRALGEESLPPDAKPGECYARVFVPPTYKTEVTQVLKREASERIEISPARYQWVEERVLVKPASEQIEVVPAVYESVEEKVLVKPASQRIEEVPAEYETVTEQVVDNAEHTVWKKGRGPVEKLDHTTGEIMCLVKVPATYKTVTKRVLKKPASTRTVEIPAEYKTVRKQVMKTPQTTRTVSVPDQYETVMVWKLVTPAQERRIPIPAEYQSVTKTVLASEGKVEWQPVLCQTNMSREMVTSIQQALKRSGFYKGPVDGNLGSKTMAAIRSFQTSKRLPAGNLTIATLKLLGVRL